LTGCALRGGSWINDGPDLFRAVCRLGYIPGDRYYYIGFRIVLHLQKDPDR